MRQIGLKDIRARLTQELLDLPFEITKNGKVVAVVSGKGLNFIAKGLNSDIKGLNNHKVEPIVKNGGRREIKQLNRFKDRL